MEKISDKLNQLLGMKVQDIIGDDGQPLNYVCDCGELVKEQRMQMLGGPRKGEWFRAKIGCRCEDKELAQKTVESREKARVNYLRDKFDANSDLNEDLKKASFKSFVTRTPEQQAAYDGAMKYLKEFSVDEPKNLILYGPPQLGKSHLAKSISDEVMKMGFSSLFIKVPKLLTKIKSTYNNKSELTEEEILNLLKEVDLLVIDDIGAEKNERATDKGWSDDKIFQIYDDRQGKATITTSNLTDDGLEKFYNERTYKRMMNGTDKIVVRRSIQ